VLHAQGPDEWRVGLDDNVVRLAEGRNVLARVERTENKSVDALRRGYYSGRELTGLRSG
jgi:hypothetical protein